MLYNKIMQNLVNKTVLITGSSRGIGAETAVNFAKEGCNVIITFVDEISQAKEVSKKCEKAGAKSVEIVHLDVTKPESIKSALKTIILKFGAIDILVNNAGVIRWKKFESQSDEDILEQINTNLAGLILMTKYCLQHIRDCIINIASGAASHPVKDLSVYSATKHGVRGFTEVLAIEEVGLSVYSVSPTMTSTEMTDYHGMPASKVAEVIVQTAKDGYGMESGSDIRVWEVLNKKPAFMGSK
ncbi:NAD(P)-dependent oxidoreductase [Candidatus Saccharibacteria bacterium]|nr:NAD(P)-dependent oxidoreductase [Candidatus Saccharibacteria bacterium]